MEPINMERVFRGVLIGGSIIVAVHFSYFKLVPLLQSHITVKQNDTIDTLISKIRSISVEDSIAGGTNNNSKINKHSNVILEQVANVGYSFYVGKIDHPDNQEISDELKNKVTQIIHKSGIPKKLLTDVAIIFVNTLAVSPDQHISTPVGDLKVGSFSPEFLEGGGLYTQYDKDFSLILINKTVYESNMTEEEKSFFGQVHDYERLVNVLTHELGHHVGAHLTDKEWNDFYQLRDIPRDISRHLSNWQLSPVEDFAEVYRHVFIGTEVRTAYGHLVDGKYSFARFGECSKVYDQFFEEYMAEKGGSPGSSEYYNNYSKLIDEANELVENTTQLQNCRRDVLLHKEKYPQDWSIGIPYISMVDDGTKAFILGVVRRLDK